MFRQREKLTTVQTFQLNENLLTTILLYFAAKPQVLVVSPPQIEHKLCFQLLTVSLEVQKRMLFF